MLFPNRIVANLLFLIATAPQPAYVREITGDILRSIWIGAAEIYKSEIDIGL
jgi:hypothetical protein